MDIGTGKRYETLRAALADGVPASDVAYVIDGTAEERVKAMPDVRFASGPFKGRTYRRDPKTGNLVRVGGRK
jgi:hypothetical protein